MMKCHVFAYFAFPHSFHSRRSTQAQPAEGRLGPSDDDDDDDDCEDDDDADDDDEDDDDDYDDDDCHF